MASDRLLVRVWVPHVWDSVVLDVARHDTMALIKERSLAEATGMQPDPSAYEIKFRGALVSNESQTLAALDVPSGAPMIVLPVRRRPVA